MNRARLTRLALLVLALATAIALAVVLVWPTDPPDAPAALVSARWVGSASDALAPLTARASSAAAGAPPELAIDARSAGALPYAWRAVEGDRAPWLALRFRAPMALTAVLARALDGDAATLSLDQTELGAGRRIGNVVWWQVPPALHAVAELRVTGARSVAEIVPIYAGADTWLVQQAESSDWSEELLNGHGIRPLAVIPVAVLDQLASLARAPGRLIVPNEAFDASLIEVLRARVGEGWTLLELGPTSGVCGAPSAGGPAQRLELSAQNGERFHWLGSLSQHVPCAGCTRGAALLRGPLDEPAFVAEHMGQGLCLRWLSDLPKGLRRLRQGTPERAGQDTIGADGLKPADLLVDDLQPADYAAPHADRLIEQTLAALAPAQRLHLLPPEIAALLVITADQDYAPDAALLAQLEEIHDGAASALLTDATIGTPPDVDFKQFAIERLSVASAARLEQLGHSAGIHASLLHLPGGTSRYAATLQAHAQAFAKAYGAAPRIARNHHIVWDGFVTMAESQARAGIVMNLDYVALAYRGRGALGFLNGSAFPLRFSAADGSLLPIYQQGTELDDHVLMDAKFGYERMQVADLINVQRRLFDQAVGTDPHVIVVNHHPAWWHATKGAWQRALLADAKSRNIPVWDAARWLRHVEAVRATLIDRTGVRSLRVLSGAADVSLLLPHGTKVSAQGRALATKSRRVGGRDYAWVVVPAASNLQLEIEP